MNMRLALILAGILLVCLSLPAQTAPTTSTTPVAEGAVKGAVQNPQLTLTEKLAIKSLQQEFSDLQKLQVQAVKDLQEFQKEVEASHPGYVFDPQTATLMIMKPTPKPEPKSEEKK